MKKRILITGASGLIGKESISYLDRDKYDVCAISSKDKKDDKINWIKCDLFDLDKLKEVFDKIKPEYLLHFAWITGGDYLTNDKNMLYKTSSEKMLEFFKQNGGKRAIYAGTCFEYDLKGEILKENSPLKSNNLYEQTKNDLHVFCTEYSKANNLSFGWGRIFYVFGHNEKSSRLTASIIENLKNNIEFNLSAPNNYLDYMYTKDIAHAFVKFLESDYFGSVNICSGKGILLKDYALTIQNLMGKENLIKFDGNKPSNLKVVGDNSILKNIINFRPEYDVYSGLKEVISNL